MARAKVSLLAVKKKRLELPISKKPRFESLGDGLSLGYRRNQGAGTWVSRKADGKGGSSQKVIGFADDYEDADGMRVLSWAQAQATAFAGASERGQGSASRLSVREAIERYQGRSPAQRRRSGQRRAPAPAPPRPSSRQDIDRLAFGRASVVAR